MARFVLGAAVIPVSSVRDWSVYGHRNRSEIICTFPGALPAKAETVGPLQAAF